MSIYRKQSGVVLLVALVFLLILTVAGVSAMRLATVEERMTGNFADRSVAFQAAEAALQEGEEFLRGKNYQQDNFYESCVQTECFQADCTNGLCFTGEFDAGDECVITPASSPSTEIYQDVDVWADGSGRHRVAVFDLDETGPIPPARYVIEFYCFAVKTPEAVPSEQYDASNRYSPTYWEPLYRVTALGFGRNGSSRVMLQSIFRRD
ncbi:pilus assembly PilX family protein [Reinekea blandensis]|uniref:Type 4 fimbrial biogenesis protein PilX N-terminal domain-containing protein n=1 Tax=Reinekea blandensis MED297 TaxID=314283 RepID=A4BJK5_9GAMM|nr:PilX N-terminal domain-containing pilus assembly protein [Reinekea blandensis]EAR07709.1 hypothetical protein MED297_18211 [Reinekea sp. MED297] [Reinekea blandensis MED297]